MKVETTLKFLELKTGEKQDGKKWYLVKTLDNDDKHFNFFVKHDKKIKDLQLNDQFNVVVNMYYNLKEKAYEVYVNEVLL